MGKVERNAASDSDSGSEVCSRRAPRSESGTRRSRSKSSKHAIRRDAARAAARLPPRTWSARSNCRRSAAKKSARFSSMAAIAPPAMCLARSAEQLRVPLSAIDGPPAVSPETEKLSPRFPPAVPLPSRSRCRIPASRSPWRIRSTSRRSRRSAPSPALRVDPVLAPEQEIVDAVDRYYGESGRTQSAISTAMARRPKISSICATWRAKRPSFAW